MLTSNQCGSGLATAISVLSSLRKGTFSAEPSVKEQLTSDIASPNSSEQITKAPSSQSSYARKQPKGRSFTKDCTMTDASRLQDFDPRPTAEIPHVSMQPENQLQNSGFDVGNIPLREDRSADAETMGSISVRDIEQLFGEMEESKNANKVAESDNKGPATEKPVTNGKIAEPPTPHVADHIGHPVQLPPSSGVSHYDIAKGSWLIHCREDRRQEIEERVVQEAAGILGLSNVTPQRVKDFFVSKTVLPVLKAWKLNSFDNPPKKTAYKCNINTLFSRSLKRHRECKPPLNLASLQGRVYHKVSQDTVFLLVQWNVHPGGMLEARDGRDDIPFLRAARFLALVAQDLYDNRSCSFFGRLLEDVHVKCQLCIPVEDPPLWPTEGWKDAFLAAAGGGDFARVPPSLGVCPPEEVDEMKALQQQRTVEDKNKSKTVAEDRKRNPCSLFQRGRSQINTFADESVEVDAHPRPITPLESAVDSARQLKRTLSEAQQKSSPVPTSEVQDHHRENDKDDGEDQGKDQKQEHQKKHEREQDEEDEDEEPVSKKRRSRRLLMPTGSVSRDSLALEEENFGSMPTPAPSLEQPCSEKENGSKSDNSNTVGTNLQLSHWALKEKYYEQEIAGLHRRLATYHAEKEALQHDSEHHARRVMELESDIIAKVRRVRRLNGEKMRLENESRVSKEENQAYRTNVGTLQEQLECSRRAEETLKAQLLELGGRNEELWKKQLEASRERAKEAEDKFNDVHKRLKAEEAEKADLQKENTIIKEACGDILNDWEARERIWNRLRELRRT